MYLQNNPRFFSCLDVGNYLPKVNVLSSELPCCVHTHPEVENGDFSKHWRAYI